MGDVEKLIKSEQSSLAYIFPGQGSQYEGLGKDLAANFELARRVFEEVDEALGFSISRLCFEGTAADLQLTENTQPAILATSVATARAMASVGCQPAAYVAGHSLGEYSALVASGAIALAEAARTVRARGRYMQEAVPVGTGAMAAILGSNLETIEKACHEASGDEVCAPANLNSPKQVVIAGNTAAVDRAMELLKAAGAKRVVKLNVSAPFHCLLMKPAQDRLSFELEQMAFSEPQVPLVTNVDARLCKTPGELREALLRQVSSPVRWQESVELLLRSGVNTFVEVGPGKVLSGLVRQIDRDANVLNVEDAASLGETQTKLAA